jgi:hypothetical protein
MRYALAVLALGTLAACAHGGSPAEAPSAASGSGKVGYVRMNDLVRKHPLYPQLTAYETNIEALDLGAVVPHAAAAEPDLRRQEVLLQQQLAAAAKRTDTLLQQKSRIYQERENAAIAAALRQTNVPGAASVGGVGAQIEGTAQGQIAAANGQAGRDLDTFRKQLEAQDNAQIASVQQTQAARADRTYRAKAEELNAQEAALSLSLAQADAPERLQLRTKLSSLALDDAARTGAENRIAALDRKEADAVAALHARDVQTLAALQTQLRAEVTTAVQQQVAQIRARSLARFRTREAQLHAQFAAPAGPLIVVKGQNGKPTTEANPNLPPALRQQIQKLHADYTSAFQADAKSTIAGFNRTRADITQRYDALSSADAAGRQSVQNEIHALQKKHDELYTQMVDQIGREVKAIAQQRGITVVLSSVAAPPGGIDLTDDVMKDIESLHE